MNQTTTPPPSHSTVSLKGCPADCERQTGVAVFPIPYAGPKLLPGPVCSGLPPRDCGGRLITRHPLPARPHSPASAGRNAGLRLPETTGPGQIMFPGQDKSGKAWSRVRPGIAGDSAGAWGLLYQLGSSGATLEPGWKQMHKETRITCGSLWAVRPKKRKFTLFDPQQHCFVLAGKGYNAMAIDLDQNILHATAEGKPQAPVVLT